ncbi:MAG TPA: FAD-dependent oxidoreductase [Gammaproteobacteria bacterium]|nr:FAD-dependent oxidoreductase [Gammaproteobacteria bacterium]
MTACVQPRSAWMDVAPRAFAPLERNSTADVCVVGAGIAGLSTAYALACEGRSVVVLDDGAIGGGMTQRTTAHLSNAVDDRYFEIERMHGEDGARVVAASHTAAIDRIEQTAAGEGIDCDFERVDGFLFVPPDESHEILEREIAAAHRAGLTGVEWLELQPLGAQFLEKCLRFPRQAQFHPLKYLNGVAEAVARRGGQIFCGTHAASVEGRKALRVETTSGHKVSAGAVVVATNTPINDVVAIHTKQAPYSTYVVALRIPALGANHALYWDTLDPYHYVRLQRYSDYELLIVGGEDHKSGQANDGEERFARLERWAREHFPIAEAVELRWSGQVMEPADGVAFIGRNPGDSDGVYIATGDSGMGMTHGTIAGILLTDLIMGRASPWTSLYDPSRKMVHGVVEFAKENVNVAAQYLKDYASGGERSSADELAPGEGAILRRGLAKIAAFRDEDGTLHELSATCPHLGCVVSFDAVEKTWNCPCHGSRFDCHGHVVVGPANRDLQRA